MALNLRTVCILLGAWGSLDVVSPLSLRKEIAESDKGEFEHIVHYTGTHTYEGSSIIGNVFYDTGNTYGCWDYKGQKDRIVAVEKTNLCHLAGRITIA
jgi:hypothetical protein